MLCQNCKRLRAADEESFRVLSFIVLIFFFSFFHPAFGLKEIVVG